MLPEFGGGGGGVFYHQKFQNYIYKFNNGYIKSNIIGCNALENWRRFLA